MFCCVVGGVVGVAPPGERGLATGAAGGFGVAAGAAVGGVVGMAVGGTFGGVGGVGIFDATLRGCAARGAAAAPGGLIGPLSPSSFSSSFSFFFFFSFFFLLGSSSPSSLFPPLRVKKSTAPSMAKTATTPIMIHSHGNCFFSAPLGRESGSWGSVFALYSSSLVYPSPSVSSQESPSH